MISFAERTVAVDIPAPLETFSSLVVDPHGPRVIAALMSQGTSGPWVVVNVDSGEVEVGRGITPLRDGVLEPPNTARLLTYRGLTEVRLSPPAVLGTISQGLGRGKDDHEHQMVALQHDRYLVGRIARATSKVVSTGTGQVLSRVAASAPFLTLSTGDNGQARVWAMGSGTALTIYPDGSTSAEPAPHAIAATGVGDRVVAVLGALDLEHRESLGHEMLRLLSPDTLRARLRGPYTDLRLAVLTNDLTVETEQPSSWLPRAVDDPDSHAQLRMTVDGAGRAVLASPSGLTLIDPHSLQMLARHRTAALPVCWPGTSQAVYLSGEREFTIVTW